VIDLRHDVPLAQHSTLGVGGPARYWLDAADSTVLGAGLAWARQQGVATLVLGGGSNVLVSDDGFDGLVLRVGDDSVRWGDVIRVGAGADWNGFVAAAVGRGLAGVECLAGIPGRVGAAPIQNVGAYGQEVADRCVSVDVVDRESGDSRTMSAADCAFAYRHSVFKGALRDRLVVTAVSFRLTRGGAPTLAYRELAQRAEQRGATTLAAVSELVRELRRGKGMLIDPDGPRDPDTASAGSFFTNPLVSPATAAKVATEASRRGLGSPPAWPAGDRVKLSAAWLIERAGIARGDVLGGAGVSTRHVLALTNRGAATAADLIALAARVAAAVRAAWGIGLVPEPVFVGFDRPPDDLLESP